MALEDKQAAWDAIRYAVADHSVRVANILLDSVPIACDDQVLTIAFADRHAQCRFLRLHGGEILEQAVYEVLCESIQVRAVQFKVNHCAECRRPLDPRNRKIFCNDACRDVHKTVRFIRRKISQGVLVPVQVRYGAVREEELAEGLYNKLRFARMGGYGRSVSRVEREAVVRRDGGRCACCGAEGTEIDHIRGGRAALDNYQLLCGACHARKTQSTSREGLRLAFEGRSVRSWSVLLRELVSTSEPVRDFIAERILIQEPARVADTDEWDQLWRPLLSLRTIYLKRLLDDLYDGDVPDFPRGTKWADKMDEALFRHGEEHDEVPCEIDDCPECDRKVWTEPGDWREPTDDPSVEAWLDNSDVHAGYGPGSYFGMAMEKD